MDIKSKYKDVLIDLFYAEKGLLAYTLYGRYKITPSEIVSFINEYKNQGYLQIDNEHRISLTNSGRLALSGLLQSLPRKESYAKSYLNSILITPCKDIYEPYLPDETFFINYYKGKR